MDDRVTAWFCDLYHWDITGDIAVTLTANTCLSANHAGPSVLIQTDDRMSCFRKSCKPSRGGYGEKWVKSEVSNTLNTFENTDIRTTLVICHEDKKLIALNDQVGVMNVSDKANTLGAQDHGHPPIICLEGNGIRPSHRGGGYSEEGKMFTLNTIERHAVCYPVISLQANAIDRNAKMNGCGWSEGGGKCFEMS